MFSIKLVNLRIHTNTMISNPDYPCNKFLNINFYNWVITPANLWNLLRLHQTLLKNALLKIYKISKTLLLTMNYEKASAKLLVKT